MKSIMSYMILAFCLITSFNISAMSIHYEVSFPAPETHYVHVKMMINDIGEEKIDVSLPVWTPGSYLIREYAQHLETISAKNNSGKSLDIVKQDKNTWQVMLGRSTSAVISYTMYCFDPTVRTNFVDSEQATLIGANTFLYVEGAKDQTATIEFKPFKTWSDIATSMPMKGKNKWLRTAVDYDFIVDNPVVLGELKEYKFKAGGVPHRFVMLGENNANMDVLINDLQRICEEEIRLFGDSPCDEYLFILLNTENRYNGLEHLNCSLNQLPRWDFQKRDRYHRSMGLLSHEYFHLWNVKRIRPVELSSFDYNTEVYTRQLWVAEGLTSYYDDYTLFRAGVMNKEEYLKLVAKMLNGVLNNSGDRVQSLTEASHDAWIKYYRKNENSGNNLVTYYDKGAMMVHALNLLIMHETGAKHSFNDVLRKLWSDYKARPETGYSEAEFIAVVEGIAGVELDEFFQKHIYGTEVVDYARYFAYAGLELVDTIDHKNKVHLGMTLKWERGKLMISKLNRKYGAYKSGLNVHDEILAIDNYRVTTTYEKFYAHKKVGDKIKVMVDRQGVIMEVEVELSANTDFAYTLTPIKKPGKLQKKIQALWLGVM